MGFIKSATKSSLLALTKKGNLTPRFWARLLEALVTKDELIKYTNGGSSGIGSIDHGALTGRGDDDHSKYLLASDATSRAAFATNWTDLTDSGATTLHTHTNAIHVDVAGEIQGIGAVASAIDEDSVFVFEKADDSWAKDVVEFDVLSNLVLASAAPGYSSTVPIVTVLADGTSDVVTVTLPDAATSLGYIYTVKAINVDNAVTLAPGGADTIDGSSSSIGLALMQSISVQSDGSNWWILDVLDHLRMANIGTNTHAQIDSHIADVLTNPHSVIASQVNFDAISGGGATYVSVQDFLNQAWSSGIISGFAMTEGASYAVDVAAGTAAIASADDENARIIYPFNFAGASTAVIADGTTRYVAIEYNGGTPQVVLSATSDLDRYDAFPLGWVTREGTTLHITNAPQHIVGIPHRIGHTLREVWGFRRADRLGGLVIGNTGTRNPTLSAGEMYFGLNEFEVSAVDCSGAGTFSRYYRVAGVWTREDSLQTWPNTLYTDGSNLQTMTVNRYGNVWWYLDPEGGELIMLYGTSNAASQSTAEAEAPPATVPLRVSDGCVLIGRFVYKASGAAPVLVQSAFNAAFNAAGATDHTLLSNIGTNTHAQIDTFIGTTVPGTYLPLAGGTVTGDILASPTATQDLGSSSFKWQALYVGGVLADSVAVGGVAVVTTNDLAGYLPLAGGEMAGDINLMTNQIRALVTGFPTVDDILYATTGAGTFCGSVFNSVTLRGIDANPKYYDGTTTTDIAISSDLSAYLLLAGGTMTGNLEIEDGSLATQHNFASVSGDVDLCQQGGQVTIGGSGGTQTLTVVGGAIGVDNGWAFRGKTTGGTYVDLLKVESGGYRCIIGVTGSRTKIVSNDSALLPFPTSAVSDANHDTKTWTVWVDESAHTLNFKVKYSTGTVKSGSIALA